MPQQCGVVRVPPADQVMAWLRAPAQGGVQYRGVRRLQLGDLERIAAGSPPSGRAGSQDLGGGVEGVQQGAAWRAASAGQQ